LFVTIQGGDGNRTYTFKTPITNEGGTSNYTTSESNVITGSYKITDGGAIENSKYSITTIGNTISISKNNITSISVQTTRDF